LLAQRLASDMVPTANPDLPALFRDIDQRHAAVRADTRISEFLAASPASSAGDASSTHGSDAGSETDEGNRGDDSVVGQDPGA
jgi:hypothetical protein